MHAGRAAILERWILRRRYNRTPVSSVRLERFLPETAVRGDEHRRAWNHHTFSRVRFLKITGSSFALFTDVIVCLCTFSFLVAG